MRDVMIDLETMGNTPQAAIVAIGAVAFSIEDGQLGETFYTTVDLANAVASGGVMDAGTVLWWLKQSDAARAELTRPNAALRLDTALFDFNRWMSHVCDCNDVRVWGNGAAFDCVILASAYRATGINLPWNFWNERCYRTVKALHPDIKLERTGTHHNALDDAKSQAAHLLAMLRPRTADELARLICRESALRALVAKWRDHWSVKPQGSDKESAAMGGGIEHCADELEQWLDGKNVELTGRPRHRSSDD